MTVMERREVLGMEPGIIQRRIAKGMGLRGTQRVGSVAKVRTDIGTRTGSVKERNQEEIKDVKMIFERLHDNSPDKSYTGSNQRHQKCISDLIFKSKPKAK